MEAELRRLRERETLTEWETLPSMIGIVDAERKWVKITIDSGAAESVCPADWAQ